MLTLRFQLLFILIYALEQVSLVLLIYQWPEEMGLIISLFLICILSTFAAEKLILENELQGVRAELQLMKLRQTEIRQAYTTSTLALRRTKN